MQTLYSRDVIEGEGCYSEIVGYDNSKHLYINHIRDARSSPSVYCTFRIYDSHRQRPLHPMPRCRSPIPVISRPDDRLRYKFKWNLINHKYPITDAPYDSSPRDPEFDDIMVRLARRWTFAFGFFRIFGAMMLISLLGGSLCRCGILGSLPYLTHSPFTPGFLMLILMLFSLLFIIYLNPRKSMGKLKKTLTNLLIGLPLGLGLVFGSPNKIEAQNYISEAAANSFI